MTEVVIDTIIVNGSKISIPLLINLDNEDKAYKLVEKKSKLLADILAAVDSII